MIDISTEIDQNKLCKHTVKKFFKNKTALLSIATLLSLILCAIIIPSVIPEHYHRANLSLKNLPPSFEHFFGTDELGRNIFIRMWSGVRISLLIGFSAAFVDVTIGIIYGGFAGMLGGKVDEIMMRIADVLNALPYLLVVMILTILMDRGITTIILAMTLTGWLTMSRIIRTQILSLKEQDFIKAAHIIGVSKMNVLFRHLIPNCFGSIITIATFTIPHAIFTESFLSFMGLGVQPPNISLGSMVSSGLPAITFYPWRVFFPAIFISVIMLSFNLLGDKIRISLSPGAER